MAGTALRGGGGRTSMLGEEGGLRSTALHKHQTPELGGGVRLLGQFTAKLQLVPRCFGASGRAELELLLGLHFTQFHKKYYE